MTHTLKLSAIAAAMFAAGACMAATTHAPDPAKPVDLAKFYSGSWAEIGRHPMKITDGCVAGATEYKAVSATKIAVRDICHDKTPSGKLKDIGGPATILDPGTNAKLHVSYKVLGGVITINRDYWVLDHADDYSWFISSDPTFENLWIYTRDPRVDRQTLDGLIARAKSMGYDVGKLEFPAQP